MPQMMPMMWLISFILTFLIILIMMAFFYFTPPLLTINPNMNNLKNLIKWNWMW